MKIIVMDSANVRIEVLNVPDHMIEEDIEQFLAEHDYSLNNISWMAAPIDFVPVQFHEYGICHSDGEELHFVRQGKLKDFSIYDSVQEVKHREQEELAERLKLRGEKVDDGYEWRSPGGGNGCPLQYSRLGYTMDRGTWRAISQFSSVTPLYLTLYDHMDCSTPGFPAHHQLPELAQIHVH